ncbi:MAG: tyrosine-type recombinase/integrase [Desulfovibrionaceae bacterium]|nr:tyrosine-type recombinase/integrase [Desulfovibrionaceae bacterium]
MGLNDKQVRALHRAAQKGEAVSKVSDGGGLNLVGGKYWRLSYRYAGKQKTLALGVYPAVSLAMARKGREKAREQLAAGIDPSERKKVDKAEAVQRKQEEVRTFRHVAMEYFQRQLANRREMYWKQTLARLENQVFPFLGDIPVSSIKPTHILAGLREVEARGSVNMAHRLASLIRLVLSYAVACGYAEFNAAAEVKGAMTPKPKAKPRAAILEKKKIGQLLRDIDAFPCTLSVQYALKLMPYLFVRSNELRGARWEEIDFETAVWTIPAARMKMKREHAVPLPRQVIALLQELKASRLEYGPLPALLFPSSRAKGRPITDEALLRVLRSLEYTKEEMCIHGFRSIASTLLNETGRYRFDVIEAALAHTDKNQIRAAYNRTDYLEERRTLMQDWADMLDALREGKDLPPLPEKLIGLYR